MNHRDHRAFALVLASLAGLTAPGATAQGLRLPATPQGQGLTLPAPAAALAPATSGTSGTMAASAPQAGRGSSATGWADFIVAVVNSEPVTNNEVRSRLVRTEAQIARQGASMPSREWLAHEVLERLILERVQLQQARESGIRVDDFALAQAEQGVARQNGMTLEQFYARLERDGIGKERFRAELRDQLLEQRLREREVDARVQVSEQDIDQYLREEPPARADAKPMEINLGHVLVLVPENATPAQVAERRARAQQAAERLRSGADFATVAREFSDAPEGQRAGGMLGLRPVDRYPELFVSSTRGLPVGSLVGPVRSPAGFHLLKVEQRVIAGQPATVLQSHARHILLRTGPRMSETAAAERLADYRRRVLAGQADFAALAREHSQDDGSAKKGGDLGWANPGQYVPEFEQALQALQPGDISAPLVTRFGVHLIELLERRQASLTAREQRDLARQVVREKKLDQAYISWTQDLRARAYVEYRDPPR
ncbi:peptidylprolyl isomerase [Verminephrobacter eiseniae]|uniref:peptidylprolyl isomerase n=1 Tax=Verminephrobacter eiseniae TaxID=364317 RepID=UPI0022380EEF|nr:peptidylprolyl isomerase [Verminephrobacter eiseniae]MCW5236820.1 molecular chaperone SurA [Verminephrobacter eiseniae]